MDSSDAQREFDHKLARWMTEEAPVRARAELLQAVLERTSAAPQQRPRDRSLRGLGRRVLGEPWRFPATAPLVRLVLAALLVSVAVGGFVLLASQQGPIVGTVNTGAPSAVPPTSPSPASQEPSARPAWLAGAAASPALEPGVPYYFLLPVRATFTVPAGWNYGGTGPNGSIITSSRQPAYVGFFVTDNLYQDPCHWQKGTLDPPVGPTVDDLITALEKVPGFVIAGPTSTTVGGLAARSLTLTATVSQSTCDGGGMHLWWSPNGTESDLHGGTLTVRVLNAGDTRFLLTSWMSVSDASVASDIATIVRSISFK